LNFSVLKLYIDFIVLFVLNYSYLINKFIVMNYIVGHKNPDTDSVISAIAYANFKGEGYIPAVLGELNNETKFVLNKFGVKAPILLESVSDGDRVILVDHNEGSQTLDGVNDYQIIEILDHHKVNISFSNPINITTKPYGSTASLITEKFLESKKPISKEVAGLLLSAILSDTVIFKSPTTTDKDKEFVAVLLEIAGVSDVVEYGMELFKKKAEISSKTASEIINGDFKEFDFNGKKVGIGQIELIDANDINPKKEEIINEMEKINNNGYFAVLFIVTDIMKEGSYFFAVGNKESIFKAFEITEENNYKQGVLSRKKQVVPVLQNSL